MRLRALIDGVAEAGDRPETAGGFWDCLAGLVAMGWSDAAADLVALHSCWAEWRQGMAAAKPAAELLEAVVALIGTAPRMATADEERPAGDGSYPPSVATSVPQFQAFREAWTRQVRDVLSDGALFDAVTDDATSNGARGALEVLAGDETALARARVPGRVARAHDRVRASSVPGTESRRARRADGAVRGAVRRGGVARAGRLLGAIIAGDASRTTDVCARYFSPWFIAHLAEMLAASAGGPAAAMAVRGRRRIRGREDGFPFGVLGRRGVARDDLLRVARDEGQHTTPGAQVPPPLRRPGAGRRRADPATGAPAAGELRA